MSDGKKKRMSMLDDLAKATPQSASMISTNRALRSARDAVDGLSVWELDPFQIDIGERIYDRLDLSELDHLRASIETNGQTVPILVRRDPNNADRYLLVYGYRRLEAIRKSTTVDKVKALVATMDEDAATTAQISENNARRDLTFIERALFADRLCETGWGSQTRVAEVLGVTRSSVSMALAIVETISRDLCEAIGSAQGIGRPRWEAMSKLVADTSVDVNDLIQLAGEAHGRVQRALVLGDPVDEPDSSIVAFNDVFQTLERMHRPCPEQTLNPPKTPKKSRGLSGSTSISRTGKGVRLDLPDGEFADWFEASADAIMSELHDRWKNSG